MLEQQQHNTPETYVELMQGKVCSSTGFCGQIAGIQGEVIIYTLYSNLIQQKKSTAEVRELFSHLTGLDRLGIMIFSPNHPQIVCVYSKENPEEHMTLLTRNLGELYQKCRGYLREVREGKDRYVQEEDQ